MLLTDSLNQWKGLLERDMRGEKLELGSDYPGYAEFYEEWKKKDLHLLSAEERTQLFSDDIADEVQKRMERIFAKKWTSTEKKNELKALAKRGDLCLVSTDEGKHFEQALSLKELSGLDPLKVRFFSPALTSVTSNYERLKEEQNLLHVSKNLRANHCLVERGYVENHKVHVDIVHSRMQASEVHVDLNEASKVWDYIFKSKDGSEKRVSETQLPEEFGVIETHFSFEEEIQSQANYMIGVQPQGNEAAVEAGKRAGIINLVTVLAAEKAQLDQAQKLNNLALINQEQEMKKEQDDHVQKTRILAAHLQKTKIIQNAASQFSANVIASKAAMAARIAEQVQQRQTEELHYKQAVQAHEVAQRQMYAQQQEQRAEKKKKLETLQKTRKVVAAASSVLTGGAVAGFSFLGWWIPHVNTL